MVWESNACETPIGIHSVVKIFIPENKLALPARFSLARGRGSLVANGSYRTLIFFQVAGSQIRYMPRSLTPRSTSTGPGYVSSRVSQHLSIL